ncbi:Cu2+-exporting ATPase [Glaciecola punicea ACAM 611]|uniref:Cu2+-exporting ATPase n=1 Tax=Glaciecola punicea ACAM 611 TaxID=1121923 RepID=H5T9L4_9ALTE|nr:heavy metal translocating P-type ATPase [Glaciecola punicea]GAB54991.1 Cu2+-exporting ATPase [Glaciecola punicea ACAM 611]
MSIVITSGHCFHCGLPNTEGNAFPTTIQSILHHMCCPGCQAVSQAIVENGLESYYEFRTEPAARGDAALDNTMSKLAVYDEPELQEEFVFEEGKYKSIQLTVEGITCAACGWLIEKQLAKLDGIKQVSVNVSSRRAMISWDESLLKLSGVLSRLKSVGYESLPFQPDRHEASYKKEQKAFIKKLGLAGIMTMQVMMLAMGQYFDVLGSLEDETVSFFNAVSLLLTTPVVLYSGSIFYVSAFKALMARTVNMDVPVTIAIVATYIAGIRVVNKNTGEVYFESICMFIFFLLIGRYLEHRARHKASLTSANMLKLIPVTAQKQTADGFVSVLAKQLVKDDIVLVKAGETVPVDGQITEGRSYFDESMLTGEFEPVIKTVGQRIYAGSLNQQDSIVMEVEASVKYAMMNQILRLQELAMANKPKVAAIADKLSRYFVVVVLVIAALTYSYWTMQNDPHAFWIAISILIATCPCALSLATPSALTCAMAKLNELGILLKRADALEQLTQTTDIVFDKTGTLTRGEFAIARTWINPISETHFDIQKDTVKPYVMALTNCIESRSEHPISKAFERYIHDNNDTEFSSNDFSISDYTVSIGEGVKTAVNQQHYLLGSQSMILSSLNAPLSREIGEAIKGANVLLSSGGVVLAAFWVTDTVHPDALDIVRQLSQHELTILSGDTQVNVNSIAIELGIKNAVGNSTPKDKLDYIGKLQADKKRVVMLGDGINDAPVLAAADVSIAVGNASDLAKNAADVILLNPKLQSVVDVLTMAKRTKRKIKQNIAWSLGYNISVLPFAVVGWLTPWQAALGMSLSSIIVVYNSTRLMR